MAATVMMEGYETLVVPSFFSYQPFSRFYGVGLRQKRADDTCGDDVLTPFNDVDGDGRMDRVVGTYWQTAITVGTALGQLIGLFIVPPLTRRLGYRISALIGLTMVACFLMIPFGSSFIYYGGHQKRLKNGIFMMGETLLGIPWGLFQGLVLPYVSDITPHKLKGPATTLINAFWILGQVVGCAALSVASDLGFTNSEITPDVFRRDIWAFRGPMLVQYIWVVPFLLIIWMAPESPQHLMRHGRDAKAVATLRRLNKDPRYDAQGNLDCMRLLDQHEKSQSSDMGIMACFNKQNIRRTEVAIMVFLTQQLVGSPLICYATKLLQKSGTNQKLSLIVATMMYLMCIVGTFASMAILRKFSRRISWMVGLTFEIVCLLAIGIGGFFINCATANYLGWLIASFIMVFAVAYNTTMGPIGYAIVSEVPATRLKTTTNSIARSAYIVAAIINLFLVPYMLQDKPEGWGLGCRAALLWAGTSAACLVWAFFRLPETKDRTPAEIDILFEQKIPVRKWETTRL